MARHLPRTIGVMLFALLVVACGGGGGGEAPTAAPPPASYTYAAPAEIGDGWAVSDLADEGFDTQKIVNMMNNVIDGSYPGIDSVAIVKNNKLVLYWLGDRELDQFDDWIGNRDKERHVLHSTSKSLSLIHI